MWADGALARTEYERDSEWTEALAVGSESFVTDARRGESSACEAFIVAWKSTRE